MVIVCRGMSCLGESPSWAKNWCVHTSACVVSQIGLQHMQHADLAIDVRTMNKRTPLCICKGCM